MLEWVGWLATVVFAGSYFCQEAVMLRRLQALAALLWIAYGIFIMAPPIIVANVVVAALALFTTKAPRTEEARFTTERET